MKPRFTLGRDTTICAGRQILLDPHLTGVSYRWQNGSAAPAFLVRDAGLYKLTATNECGSTSDEVVITGGACRFMMSDAFTPNNDGYNERFRVIGPGFIKTFRMAVYNRWGTLAFSTEDPAS